MWKTLFAIALAACAAKQPPPAEAPAQGFETIKPICDRGFYHLKLHASPSHPSERERVFAAAHATAYGHHAKGLEHVERGHMLPAREEFRACAKAYEGIADDDPNHALAAESVDLCTKNADLAQQVADCKQS
jgi:hypothetical protein